VFEAVWKALYLTWDCIWENVMRCCPGLFEILQNYSNVVNLKFMSLSLFYLTGGGCIRQLSVRMLE
jgi:hypothetical protein